MDGRGRLQGGQALRSALLTGRLQQLLHYALALAGVQPRRALPHPLLRLLRPPKPARQRLRGACLCVRAHTQPCLALLLWIIAQLLFHALALARLQLRRAIPHPLLRLLRPPQPAGQRLRGARLLCEGPHTALPGSALTHAHVVDVACSEASWPPGRLHTGRQMTRLKLVPWCLGCMEPPGEANMPCTHLGVI